MVANEVLRHFTIRTRMLGAIGMVLALLAGIGAVGLFALGRVDTIGTGFVRGVHADTMVLSDARDQLGTVRRTEKDVLINAWDNAALTRYQSEWQAAVGATHARLKGLVSGSDTAQSALAQKIDADLTRYVELAEPVMRRATAGEFASASDANKALDAAKRSIHDAEQGLDALTAHLAEVGAHSETARHEALEQANWLFGASVVIAILIVVPLTLLNMVSIARPIADAQRLAEQIATGDLTHAVDPRGEDEITSLQRALAAMSGSLRTIVAEVRSTTRSIGTSSSEIATGNLDLSTRTEQAASSLQTTASSMEQLTGTVRHSAESARQANELAGSAAEVAARGGVVVGQVVSTMDEINAASRKIGDIIGVIDSIAFQTNILALNAAVEAARAGEQGRGFAVVASEVRSLAQRSATAAREIKTLIDASVSKVEGGARLVADAGHTMTEIVDSVQRVSEMIGAITNASTTQSDGIGQVNVSIGQLDRMTQQNAALVEQSAAAAESLRDQATKLSTVVATFRLGDTDPVRTAAGGTQE